MHAIDPTHVSEIELEPCDTLGASLQRTASIRFMPRTARKISNGVGGSYLDVEGIASQAGVAEYRENGQTIREYTPPEVLADPEYIAALQGAPLTRRHPTVGLMDSLDQIRSNVIGVVRKASYDPALKGNRVTVRFYDPDVVTRDGFNALSVGYTADTDDRPGYLEGVGKYARKQTKRTAVNHVASTDNPRYDGCRLDEKEPTLKATLKANRQMQIAIERRLDEVAAEYDNLLKQKAALEGDGKDAKQDAEGEEEDPKQMPLPMPPAPDAKQDAEGEEDPDMLPPKEDECGPDGKKLDADGAVPPVPAPPAVKPEEPKPIMPPPAKGAPKMDEAARYMRIGRLAERVGIEKLPSKPGDAVRAIQKARPDLDGGHIRIDEAVAFMEGKLSSGSGSRPSVVGADIAKTFRTDEGERLTYTGPLKGLLR